MEGGVRGLLDYVEHVGFAVPDLDEAVSFFEQGLGAEQLYRTTRSDEDGFIARTFDAPLGSSFTLSMLRLPPNLNVELFQWSGAGDTAGYPHVSDPGGHHLCLHVHDIDAACAGLASFPGVRQLGEIKTVADGRLAGSRWIYILTPWGLPIELVNRSAVANPPRLVVPGR